MDFFLVLLLLFGLVALGILSRHAYQRVFRDSYPYRRYIGQLPPIIHYGLEHLDEGRFTPHNAEDLPRVPGEPFHAPGTRGWLATHLQFAARENRLGTARAADARVHYGAGVFEYLMSPLNKHQPLAVTTPTSPIFFKPTEPRSFTEYGSQAPVLDLLQTQIDGRRPGERLKPQMFLGTAGLGKTLLAKVFTNELRRANAQLGLPEPVFIEVFPADISNVTDLDAVVRRAAEAPAAVLFIDEVHGLAGVHAIKLYELLENGRYPFHGDPAPTELPNVTLVAATTDYGAMHSALKRRWVKHYLQPLSQEQLIEVLQRRGEISEAAATYIASYTHYSGAPWEAIELYDLARTKATARQGREPEEFQDTPEGYPDWSEPAVALVPDTHIQMQDVEWVVETLGMDTLGLRIMDRKVLQALRNAPRRVGGQVVYGLSERDTCVLAGVDKDEYREAIRPRLMARGLLTIRAGVGQVLTDKALQLY